MKIGPYILNSVRCGVICSVLLAAASCNTVDDTRIPAMQVSLNLASTPLWNTYGVSAYGDWRIFIKSLGEPRNFPYSDGSRTGFGGVLLVCGLNPYTMEAAVPMVYDLSCPVEAKMDIRVQMKDTESLPVAVCPVCDSHYDVVESGGAPISGPARDLKYGLTRYETRPGAYGGYYISDI
ncbi:MAG: hypothetical protein HDR84_00200 [Bacteroides sp.]|nr:hypothetical protein [Bacteroides sp.]